jgi:hypothetical protein
MLTEHELLAKMRRYGKKWARCYLDDPTPQKERKYIRLTKKINQLDKQFFERIK